MENERRLLGLYVHNGWYRSNLKEPFRQHGRICATDGRMMIRIAERLCAEEYDERPGGQTPPNTSAVMPEPDMCRDITAESLEGALKKAPEEKARHCPECGGTGTVSYEYYDRHSERHLMDGDCPECEGTGALSDYTPVMYQFTLHGQALCSRHLETLLRTMACLKTDRLRLRHVTKGKGAWPMLLDAGDGDIEILLMPQLRDKEFKEIKIKT